MRKLFIALALLTLTLSLAYAMGNKPQPPKEEPKYKLEILKMELVPAYETTPSAKVAAPKKKVQK